MQYCNWFLMRELYYFYLLFCNNKKEKVHIVEKLFCSYLSHFLGRLTKLPSH